MDGSERAKGGNVKSIFSDFDITNAAELEAHIAMNAIAARANFDEHYARKLTNAAAMYRDVRRRLDVKEPLEFPDFIVDVGVPAFDFSSLPTLFREKLKARAAAADERKAAKEAGDTAAEIGVSAVADQSLPLKLTIKNCDYTNVDKVVDAIKDCADILRLNMSGCGFDNGDSAALARLVESHPTLQALDLSNNKLGNEGLEKLAPAISKAKALIDLDLGLNEISKSGVTHINAFLADCRLERLQLAGNKLGIYGAEALVTGLRANKSLLSLGLQNNSLGNDGVSKLAGVFEVNTTIQQVALDANRADDDVVAVIAKHLAVNEQTAQRSLIENLEASERANFENDVEREVALLALLEKKSREELMAKKKVAAAASPASSAAAKKAPPAKSSAKKAAAAAPPAKAKSTPPAGSGAAAVKALSPAKKPAAKKK